MDPATTTFVDQLVPVELASVIRQQKKAPKTKLQIATDSSHAHAANARGQLSDAASFWRMISEVLAVKAIAEGYTDVPTLVRDQYEILTDETAGTI